MGLLAKMEDCLCSDESTKGFDDFSCSPFAFLGTFAVLKVANGLASRWRRNQDAVQVRFVIPSRFEVCGGAGWITSEAVGSGLTSHGLRRRVGPAA